MPAVKNSPKKSGAPKAKGAVRAKSGCYTCRIRRKKCDERPNEEGFCETCVRLRVQCLGFGAKRPEWLRENARVLDLREKIKSFLAAQGMIKGHSGAGPRNGEAEATLRLASEDYSSSSESPPTQTLSLSESEYRPAHTTSSVRDVPWLGTPGNNDSTYDHSPSLLLRPSTSSYDRGSYSAPSHASQLRRGSPYDGSDDFPAPYSFPPPALPASNSSSNLVPWTSHNGASTSLHSAHFFRPKELVLPTQASSFGPSYYLNGGLDDDLDFPLPPLSSDDLFFTHTLIPGGSADELINHYVFNVVGMQYLLYDKNTFSDTIFSTLHMEGSSREAAKLLAAVDMQRRKRPDLPALQSPETKHRYDALRQLLDQPAFSDADAMAALHTVSSVLFDGGSGEWQQWLTVACRYCDDIFNQIHWRDSRDTLMHCTDQERFLIKTTIWFDVLASVSTLRPPHFYKIIRFLWGPEATTSFITEFEVPLAPEPLSMMVTMGCENIVLWAIAETSYLAAWKEDQTKRGSLSLRELVGRGQKIESAINDAPASRPVVPQDDLDISRTQTADAFRAAAHLYVRSVVSGDHPNVAEIMEGVTNTLEAFREVNRGQSGPNAVVRSAVFAVFIAGCLTDDHSQQAFIRDLLAAESGPGNCRSIELILDEIWQERKTKILINPKEGKGAPVPWRQVLHNKSFLLV